MKIDYVNLLDFKTPVIFKDGTEVYEAFKKEYKVHKVGFFILAPSGAGITYFINSQKKKKWIDGDELWVATKAHPKFGWWLQGLNYIKEICRRCDIVTEEAKKQGLWIMGSSSDVLRPDAVVIPDWRTHKKYIKARQEGNYDGGVTMEHFEISKYHRNVLNGWVKKGVPKFKSVGDAANYLVNLVDKL